MVSFRLIVSNKKGRDLTLRLLLTLLDPVQERVCIVAALRTVHKKEFLRVFLNCCHC